MSVHRTIAAFILAVPLVATSFAQQSDQTHHYLPDARYCLQCHSEPFKSAEEFGVLDRVRLDEWKRWEDQDKHTTAFEQLSGDRGKRMGDLLNQDVLAPQTGCIPCHTANIDESLWSEECFRNDVNIAQAKGVACQTCHGPAEHWIGLHDKPSVWQKMSTAERKSVGFETMEDPVIRAEKCLSCHVGNTELGRTITHEMYAAGHPPLSGFELESFADKMPRHWRYYNEKHQDKPYQFERTRAVLLGSVIAFRTAVDLASEARDNWPELARLECYSCHHELQSPGWRQEDYAGRLAGRPRLELGCLPLVQAATLVAGGTAGAEQFDALLAQTQKPFQQNMFGDPLELVALQTAVDQWSVQVEQTLAEMPLDKESVRKILGLLLAVAAEGTHDYDTARQITGAISVVAEELSRSGAEVRGLSNLQQQLHALNERGFALVFTEDKRVEDKFHQQLSNRARFKPRVFSALMASLYESMDK